MCETFSAQSHLPLSSQKTVIVHEAWRYTHYITSIKYLTALCVVLYIVLYIVVLYIVLYITLHIVLAPSSCDMAAFHLQRLSPHNMHISHQASRLHADAVRFLFSFLVYKAFIYSL